MIIMPMTVDSSTHSIEIVSSVLPKAAAARSRPLTRAGTSTLVLGVLLLAAGCYRAAAAASHGAMHTVVPLDALPLAAELLVLGGLVLCGGAALLIVRSLNPRPTPHGRRRP
jgi:hypothetical protein